MMNHEEDEILYRFDNGDEIRRNRKGKTVFVQFQKTKKVVSTSLINGAFHDDLKLVFNYKCGERTGPCMTLQQYEEDIKKKAESIGTKADLSTGFGTAADMENAVVVEKSYEKLKVVACVTAGIEANAGSAGDPAFIYGGEDKTECFVPGTINIMLFLGADMPPGILTRAMVTCTEAKSVAIRELLGGSRYSYEPATGSGTDSTLVVADPDSSIYFRASGKHNKLGELIGLAVKEAVKEALKRQNGLDVSMQYSVRERMRRYGVTKQFLYALYQREGGTLPEEEFISWWKPYDRQSEAVTWAALYATLLDHFRWGLDQEKDVKQAAEMILSRIAKDYDVPAVEVSDVNITAMVKNLTDIIGAKMKKELVR